MKYLAIGYTSDTPYSNTPTLVGWQPWCILQGGDAPPCDTPSPHHSKWSHRFLALHEQGGRVILEQRWRKKLSLIKSILELLLLYKICVQTYSTRHSYSFNLLCNRLCKVSKQIWRGKKYIYSSFSFCNIADEAHLVQLNIRYTQSKPLKGRVCQSFNHKIVDFNKILLFKQATLVNLLEKGLSCEIKTFLIFLSSYSNIHTCSNAIKQKPFIRERSGVWQLLIFPPCWNSM